MSSPNALTLGRAIPACAPHIVVRTLATALIIVTCPMGASAQEYQGGNLRAITHFDIGVPAQSNAGPPAQNNSFGPVYYSNLDNPTGGTISQGPAATVSGNGITRLVADDITGGPLSGDIIEITFSVANQNAATVTCRARLRFWSANGSGGLPGTYLGSIGVTFPAFQFPPGVTIATGSLPAGVFPMPASKFWAGIAFDNENGTTGATLTQLGNMGQGLFAPPTLGSSDDVLFETTGAGSFLGVNNPPGARVSQAGGPKVSAGWRFAGAQCPTITASAGANGFIAPSGVVNVGCGMDQGFAITPNAGYQVADVLVDGSTVGAVGNYTFTNVTSDHTITAAFAVSGPPVTPPPFVMKWGSLGSGPGQFYGGPWGIAVSPNHEIYVTEGGNNRVQKFSSYGGFLKQWGTTGNGNGQFQVPWGLTVDHNGDVYVADYSNARIQKFSSDGNYIRQWGSWGTSGHGLFNNPIAVAVDADNNVYVAEHDGSRIQKFTSNGDFIREWGTLGSGPGELHGPNGITVDVDGNVFVTESENNRVSKFTREGVYLAQWGGAGAGNGQFQLPSGIGVDADGHVFVDDRNNNRIQEFTTDGVYLTQWGSAGPGDGQFANPMDLGIDAVGNIYVADQGNSRIQQFGPGPGLLPVVLVHGYCSDGTMWNDLGNYLTAHGFSPHAMSLTPKNGRPIDESVELANFLDTLFPGQDVNVITHSMGGLVTRYYTRQRGSQSRIKNLITLGTPHHGSDFVSLIFANKPVGRLAKLFGNCQAKGDGFEDMITGSRVLNLINYGNPNVGDIPFQSSQGPHAAERIYDPQLKVWTFAGTQGLTPPLALLSRGAWSKDWRQWAFGGIEANDGVVGESAARLYNAQASHYVDVDLGLTPIQHTPGAIFYDGGPAFESDQDLFPKLEGILRGGLPSDAASQPERMLAHQADAPTDSVVDLLVSEGGTLAPNQVLERSAVVPSTPMLRVSMVAENAHFRLRKPDGTLLTPNDTLVTPGLQYSEDATIMLGIYSVANPTPGKWKGVIDAGTFGASQEYAIATEVVSTKSVVLEPSTDVTYLSGGIRLRASLQNVGVPQLLSTWQVSVLRPDSTAFATPLYDDGAHGDSLSGDGIFANTIAVGPQLGKYFMTAQATSLPDSATYLGETMTELAVFHDLAVQGEFQCSKNPVLAGDSVMVGATIRNDGTDPITNVSVEFWDNQTKFGTAFVNLPAGGSVMAQVPWVAALPDTHNVRITVDTFAQLDEVDYANNSLIKQVILGQGIVGVDPGHDKSPLVLSLAPPMPNPSMSQMFLRYSLPRESEASLAIYNVGGRRVRAWHWLKQNAGAHQIAWDGRDEDGERTPPGVYFCRLSVNGQILKQKLVHL